MIYLASRSPRRRDLLKQLAIAFELLHLREAPGRKSDVVEVALDNEPAAHYVERIARTKAAMGWHRMEQRGLVKRPVLGADTEVVQDGEIYGKPKDVVHAAQMLQKLSGRRHEVMTGVALRTEQGVSFALSVSQVTFRKLTVQEIERYAATDEALGKAGGYAIQGRAGAFVTRLEGTYSGVVGLPLCETAGLLAKAGIAVL